MHIRRLLAAVAVPVALASVFTAPTAYASTDSGKEAVGTRWRNAQTGLCLDGSVAGGVVLKTCNAGDYQRFVEYADGTLKHVQSGRCLDGSASAGVRLNTCILSSNYQAWYTTDANQLRNLGAVGYCLDGSVSQGVRMVTCSSSRYQQWTRY
jgi:alpha-galactosidase